MTSSQTKPRWALTVPALVWGPPGPVHLHLLQTGPPHPRGAAGAQCAGVPALSTEAAPQPHPMQFWRCWSSCQERPDGTHTSSQNEAAPTTDSQGLLA